MRIREFQPGDLESIKRLHTGTFELPRIDDPLVLIKRCLVDDEDRVRMAAIGRLHVSAMLFVDGTWKTPAERFAAIRELQKEMDAAARLFGIDVATTQAEGRFAERLEALGWVRGWGEMFYREV